MTLARGRVVKGAGAGAPPVPSGPTTVPARGKVVRAVVVDAGAQAERIVAAADDRARAIVASAEARAADVRLGAAAAGRADGAASLAAAWVRLRAEEAAHDERDADRTIDLARALAERLLGEALALDPSRVVAIAREVLAHARQAHRVRLDAHPDDAAVLARDLSTLGLSGGVVEVRPDATRARGSLRVETDLGTLDADVAPQLDRLVAALRR